MGRFFSVPFSRVAMTTGQDLWDITAGTNKPFWLHEVVFGQSSDYGDAQAEGLLCEIYKGASGYTQGSGGTSPTPVPHETGGAAAGVTAKMNNTVMSLTSGLTLMRSEALNEQAGYQYLPTPETRLYFRAGEGVVVRLSSGVGTGGPADSITMSGTLVFEEIG